MKLKHTIGQTIQVQAKDLETFINKKYHKEPNTYDIFEDQNIVFGDQEEIEFYVDNKDTFVDGELSRVISDFKNYNSCHNNLCHLMTDLCINGKIIPGYYIISF